MKVWREQLQVANSGDYGRIGRELYLVEVDVQSVQKNTTEIRVSRWHTKRCDTKYSRKAIKREYLRTLLDRKSK